MSSEHVVVVNNSRVLMSDVLKDVVPDELENNDDMRSLAQNYVLVVVGRETSMGSQPLIGTLEGFMFQENTIEIEVKIELDEGLKLMRTAKVGPNPGLWVPKVEILDKEHVDSYGVENGFKVEGVRICNIDYRRRMCVLLLNLRHVA